MTTNNRWHRTTDQRGETVTITVDDRTVTACAGETLATALLADGTEFDHDGADNARAPLCNMGTCFECVATVDGRPLTRTCLIPVRDGSVITTARRL